MPVPTLLSFVAALRRRDAGRQLTALNLQALAARGSPDDVRDTQAKLRRAAGLSRRGGWADLEGMLGGGS